MRLTGEGKFRVNISVALALEYEEVLKRPGLLRALSAADIDQFLDYLFQSSLLTSSVHVRRPRLSDPDDELVIDLATQRGAAILTYNKRDFAGASKQGVNVVTTAGYLAWLRKSQ
jgi:predicted nucleic acid-binding protein